MRRNAILAAGIAAALLLCTACGASTDVMNSMATSSASASQGQMNAMMMEGGQGTDAIPKGTNPAAAQINGEGLYAEDSTASIMAAESRKVILNASFSLETKDFLKAREDINGEIAKTGSYVQYSDTSGSPEDGNARTYLTIRVPSERYNEFKEFVPTVGNVTFSSEGGQDVTSEYFDTDTRLTVLKAQETRILELLAKADTIEEMLQIENELTRIRTEIEQLTTQLKRYDDLISYATIDLTIVQTSDYTVVRKESFLTKLGQTVQDSFASLVDVLQNLVIALVWLLPYLVILAVILFLVLLVVRRHRQSHPKPPKAAANPPQNNTSPGSRKPAPSPVKEPDTDDKPTGTQ